MDIFRFFLFFFYQIYVELNFINANKPTESELFIYLILSKMKKKKNTDVKDVMEIN